MSWSDWFIEQRQQRESAGLQRNLRPRQLGDDLIDLAGNDYLGLSRDPRIASAAAQAALAWGAGSGASRLVTGTIQLHNDLEAALAEFMGQPSALVFSTGYHANLSVVNALVDKTGVIISDAHIHASLVDAARLSKATTTVIPHSDVEAVETALAQIDSGRRTIVLAESIYSVLGDAAPLVALAAACKRYDAMLVVDEAHAVGVAGVGGHGLVRELGLAGHPNVIVTATLSKSLAAQGGVVLGTPQLVDHLINRARPFIFDTGLTPSATAAALEALSVLGADPSLPAVIHRRVKGLCAQLGISRPAGAVLSVPMPSPQAAVAAQAACLAEGIRVGCFRPPSVPDGISRLRITANAGLSDSEWARAADVVSRLVDDVRVPVA